ncbi:MAG TPA: ribose 5-phosphate isomerase A, partial [Nitrospira sp.]|nr:ribose 5-phosphate isomerase A [Nitrospira sp.]
MTPSIKTLQFDLDSEKQRAALKATEYVQDGMVVGLGTGTTSKHLIIALGERVRAGLKIQAVPTSHDTAALARQSGIPL